MGLLSAYFCCEVTVAKFNVDASIAHSNSCNTLSLCGVVIGAFRCDGVVGIPKLDDANDAGGRNSHLCTLILTEGDSAKTLAISGLSVVGRDHYGVFPLR